MFALGNGIRRWDSEGYIENQQSMTNLYMGMATMAEAGCEIIATYNTLIYLGKKIALDTLITEYEKDGIIHSGKFGVAPYAIADRLKKYGLKVAKYVPDKKRQDVDGFASSYRALIVTYYNDCTDLMQQIHTVAITKDNNGYTVHNAFGNGCVLKAAANISEAIEGATAGKGRPIVLIGVED